MELLGTIDSLHDAARVGELGDKRLDEGVFPHRGDGVGVGGEDKGVVRALEMAANVGLELLEGPMRLVQALEVEAATKGRRAGAVCADGVTDVAHTDVGR